MPTSPRYEIREALVADGIGRFCVFDSFTQRFVEFEEHETRADAIRAVTRHNRAYERAIAPDTSI